MIISKKNSAYYLSFPAIDSTTPANYRTGISPVDTGYYKDGAGAWTTLSITDTASEIGSTGVYEIDLTASEMNHDKVIIKFAVSGMADDAYQFDLRTKLTDDLNDVAATDVVSAGAITTNSGAVSTVTTLTGHTAQTADHTAGIADIPTVAEFNARTLASADYVVTSDTIAGVTTCTTNTDMRGTDSAATAVELAKVPKSDSTVTWNATALASINTEADTALTDYDAPTNTEMAAAFTEIKGATWAGTDTLEGIYNGLGGSAPTVEQVRAEMDSNSTQLAAIVADTNELQTDIADGGRMDLLVDAIKVVTDSLTAAAAAKLALSGGQIITGTVETGTLSNTEMTTDLSEATDSHYDDCLIIFTSGVLAGQRSEVTTYTGSGGVGLILHPSTTDIPSNGDTFLLL